MHNSLMTWFKATRPWSLPVSVLPVALGGALAFADTGRFHWLLFLLTLVGGCSLHLGTNMINTYGDYVTGVDINNDSAPTVPELVNEILAPRAVRNVGLLFFALAALCGLFLFLARGWGIIAFGVVGIVGGYGYTAGIAYKYKGLGTVCVFFLMGPLMVGGAYFVQTARLPLVVLAAALPLGCLVASVLHNNDIRDLAYDRRAGIATLALALGPKGSVGLSWVLNLAPFVLILLLVLGGQLPAYTMLTWLLIFRLPRLFTTVKKGAAGEREARLQIEGMAVRQHLAFSLLYLGGILIGAWSYGIFSIF